ncbi:hypothetical protein V6R98_28890 [Agrobacterium sp. CCNWLW71]|uniref:hypothetical protein n=1 Tax=unclassified Agrobacterium TaxID=2632611 RepID=UPI002FF26889
MASTGPAAKLPEAVRKHPSLSAHAQLWKVEFDDRDGIELEGYDDNQHEFKAVFASDGTLLEIKFH